MRANIQTSEIEKKIDTIRKSMKPNERASTKSQEMNGSTHNVNRWQLVFA